MSVNQILTQLLSYELPRSLEIFAPELVLCVTIILLLLARMTGWDRRISVQTLALIGASFVFLGVFAQFMYLRSGEATGLMNDLFELWGVSAAGTGTPGPYFTGLLKHDAFAVFFRLGLSLVTILIIALTVLTGIPDREDSQDFYTLLLGATLGMMLASGANHLLTLFLSIEMMSVPSYMLVGFQKGKRQASEAALKYVVYGGGAAGVMLYGITLLAGITGTASIDELAQRLSIVMQDGALMQTNATSLTIMFATLLILVGFAFKLSLVPFHFWAPDAFEGACSEICAYLSVASKAAAFALLIRFLMAMQGTSDLLGQLSLTMGLGLGLVAIVTTTYGNLAAYMQTNLKRMLAYSTIAHAGYMAMAVAAILVLLNPPEGRADQTTYDAVRGIEGVIYYLAVYIFMNIGAFACIAFIRNETFSEEIDAYRGLAKSGGSAMFLSVCLAVCFISLIGIPPMGGFFGKLAVFRAAYSAGTCHWFLWIVLAVGVINTVVSVFYYMKVLKVIFMQEPDKAHRHREIPSAAVWILGMMTLPVILLGASPLMASLSETAIYVALSLFP
ncbi:NADH-quinone oxidoreductase subunit N [Planctomicrobium sp. SH668]|uniref:NADH-quinone oxidoreductase subunit N n=1 Tax=Planctomicrobium sp. SH668 TaxID=3448126 RepID=UPI003F5BBEF0